MRRGRHGMWGTSEYHSWRNMLARCGNPDHKHYAYYGGRGISVCDRWRESFDNFLADMGRKPRPGLTVERTDNDKGYDPGNCRWATRAEQSHNVRPRKGNSSGAAGVYWAKARRKWQVSITVSGKHRYVGIFEKLEDAIAARREAEQRHWGAAA